MDLRRFPKDNLRLSKRTGEIIEDVKAIVTDKMFIIDDTSLPLEEGDILERELPNGFIERYEIIDRGFVKGMHRFPDTYQVSVKKLTDIPKPSNDKHTYNITAKQVNIANDRGIINANQYNNVDIEKLNSLIAEIKQNIPSNISDEDAQILNDNLGVIEYELTQSKPRKGFLKTAITGLKAIKGTVEFTTAITSLYTFITTIL